MLATKKTPRCSWQPLKRTERCCTCPFVESTTWRAPPLVLSQNMPQLQRLDCAYSNLRLEGVSAFQPALEANRTLIELSLWACRIGDEGIRLIADSLVGNTTMQVLNIGYNGITSNGLDDLTRLLESTQLKKIVLSYNALFLDGNAPCKKRFARILSRRGFLKDLGLADCQLGDGGIHLIVDGLVGNAIMEVLDISRNDITSVGLADITRLLESTQLKTIRLALNRGVFTQHFVTTLQHKNSSAQELSGIDQDRVYPEDSRTAATYTSVNNSLTRNQQLNRVNLLLAPPPPPSPPRQQQNHHGAALMMLKIWHKAIARFATVPNNAGANALFKLFTARPQVLETRLKRPAAAVSQQQQQQPDSSFDDTGNVSKSGGGGTAINSLDATTTIGDGRKRQRL